ncbi:archaeal proteasome endopeptidase complex subunit alpha [Candidatus Woesearchaeota archaeon]|nr:MAG: proteasome alpha subunit [archaeon GW2011_AR18]MBS3162010.1 archaeal proteasome endopeptidase complex subunit alpha [Candidatus Woesearchaeota archaeon]HIH25948.1 archaeal proteasome endopeptidase complex subunit alpha [Nanoarchaeota archaeon]
MQPTITHQMMGYDRSSTMFSPDGRLLQVEYAKKAVRQGTTSLGIVCKDGVLLLADKRIIGKLIIPDSVEKVFQVDDHIGAAATGYLMDGRVLIERAQLIAQQYRVNYDSPMDTLLLVKEIANMKQAYTQFGGARPFGVSVLFAGVDDDGPQLFLTDVTGIYFQYKATAVGEAEVQLNEILEKEYADDITLENAMKLGVSAFKKIFGKEFDIERIDGAYIKTSDRSFKRVDKDYLRKLAKKV